MKNVKQRQSKLKSIIKFLFIFSILNVCFILFSRMVFEFNSNQKPNQIKRLLHVLGNDFTKSRDSHKRKGGLIGLAAASIGMGKVK